MSWRKIVFFAGLCLGLLLFLWQVWTSYKIVRQQGLCLIHIDQLVIAALLALAFYAVQLGGWAIIMRCLKVPLSLARIVEGYLLSFLPRYIPGSVWGYMSRAQWLAQACGVDYVLSITASILEALFLIMASLGLSGLYISAYLPWPARLALLTLWLGLLLWMPELTQKILKHFGLKPALSINAIGITMFYTFLWVIYGCFVWSIARALFALPTDNVWSVVFSATFAWFLGFIAIFIPGGIGIREWSLSTLLVLHAGITTSQANLIAITSRFGIVVAELIWLLIGLFFYAKRVNKKVGQWP